MLHPPKKLTTCPNCQTPLEHGEDFCPTCGQKNEDIILPVSYHLQDAVESIFNWDSRLLRTLKTLFARPGVLTQQYNSGKRKTYVPPLRFYLIASILFFLLYSLSSKKEIAQANVAFENLKDNATDTLNLNMIATRIALTGSEINRARTYDDRQVDSLLMVKNIEPTTFNRATFKQMIRMMTGELDGLFQSLMQTFSFGMFVLMPVFAWLSMLVFFRQKKYYVEHLMGALHLHTLFFLLFSAHLLVIIFFPKLAFPSIFFLIGFIYLVLHIRLVFDKKILPSFFYSLLLVILYLIVLLLALVIFGTLSLFLF